VQTRYSPAGAATFAPPAGAVTFVASAGAGVAGSAALGPRGDAWSALGEIAESGAASGRSAEPARADASASPS